MKEYMNIYIIKYPHTALQLPIGHFNKKKITFNNVYNIVPVTVIIKFQLTTPTNTVLHHQPCSYCCARLITLFHVEIPLKIIFANIFYKLKFLLVALVYSEYSVHIMPGKYSNQ